MEHFSPPFHISGGLVGTLNPQIFPEVNEKLFSCVNIGRVGDLNFYTHMAVMRNNKEKIEFQKINSISGTYETLIHILGVPEGEEEKKDETKLEEMAEYISNLARDINLQIQDTAWTLKH